MWRKSTVHLVILENLRQISLPAIITYLPSHHRAHDRSDKWIQQKHTYLQQGENNPLKISNVVKAITVCEDQNVLVEAGTKWRTNHCFTIKDARFHEVEGGKKTNVKFNGAKRYSFDHLVTHSTFAIPVAGQIAEEE